MNRQKARLMAGISGGVGGGLWGGVAPFLAAAMKPLSAGTIVTMALVGGVLIGLVTFVALSLLLRGQPEKGE